MTGAQVGLKIDFIYIYDFIRYFFVKTNKEKKNWKHILDAWDDLDVDYKNIFMYI